jgi:hypothetical protein
MTTEDKARGAFGWLAMIAGALLGMWSIYNVTTRVKPNELDILDLLLGLAVAATLLATSIRIRQRKSLFLPLILGVSVSLILFVLAMLNALKDGLAS